MLNSYRFAQAGDTVVPTAPEITSVVLYSKYFLRVYFLPSTDNVGVVGYEVWLSNNGSSFLLSGTTTTSPYTASVARNVIVYFKVRAYDAAGNYSEFSNVMSGCNNNGVPCT